MQLTSCEKATTCIMWSCDFQCTLLQFTVLFYLHSMVAIVNQLKLGVPGRCPQIQSCQGLPCHTRSRMCLLHSLSVPVQLLQLQREWDCCWEMLLEWAGDNYLPHHTNRSQGSHILWCKFRCSIDTGCCHRSRHKTEQR